ncbi:TetR family transcriptional regulator [Pseudomonas sp. M47T1]|uniref:TetR/AcrR family transcriptional regulator n=1 Tax=Pseudomonas sp. M47T1 TaxID=1179778 RepID=UPI00026075FE|nr:TetR family transcriptional regulator [Pseudomonas sp. M47T1]EIK94841.1 TetR family transcriptional regulator [Pseudomonas sp. M47T1]
MDTSTGKKKRGRPANTAAIGRDGLIEATLGLLRGIAPTDLTLQDIARQVNVDPALIRYYFGSKDGLLRAATLHLLDVTQLGAQALAEGQGVEAMLYGRIRLIIDIGRQNPHFLQLVLREIYQGNDPQPGEVLDLIAQRGVALADTLLQARPAAPGLPHIDARMLHVALVGACTFFATAQPLFGVLFAGSSDDVLAEQYSRFLTGLLLRGVGVQPA